MLNDMKKSLYWTILILVDQTCKYIALSSIDLGSLLFIHWVPTYNYGITLNLLGFLSPLILAVGQCCVLFYLRKLSPPKLSWLFIFAGASSNIIDRITHGFIIDYLSFKLLGYTWPAIVNLADIYITIGALHWIWTCQRDPLKNTGNLISRKLQSDEV